MNITSLFRSPLSEASRQLAGFVDFKSLLGKDSDEDEAFVEMLNQFVKLFDMNGDIALGVFDTVFVVGEDGTQREGIFNSHTSESLTKVRIELQVCLPNLENFS